MKTKKCDCRLIWREDEKGNLYCPDHKPERENKTMSQHTPTPWNIEKSNELNPHTVIFSDSNDLNIAEAFGEDNAEAEANAEFIVRACNSHEDLVGAIKRIQQAFGYGEIENEDDEITKNVTPQVRNLILSITNEALRKAGVTL